MAAKLSPGECKYCHRVNTHNKSCVLHEEPKTERERALVERGLDMGRMQTATNVKKKRASISMQLLAELRKEATPQALKVLDILEELDFNPIYTMVKSCQRTGKGKLTNAQLSNNCRYLASLVVPAMKAAEGVKSGDDGQINVVLPESKKESEGDA